MWKSCLLLLLSAASAAAQDEIVFVRRARDSNCQGGAVWAIAFDGTGARALVKDGDCHDALASPDGKSIAFLEMDERHQTCRLRVAAMDGKAMDVAKASSFAWSTDGMALAFTAGGIRVADRDGGNLRALTEGADDLYPVWSPDSKHIYYRSYGGTATGKLMRMTADGKKARRITDHAADVDEYDLRFSPDGRRIAFATMLHDAKRDAFDFTDLYVADAEGGDLKRAEALPTWSPDGKRIAFVTGPREGFAPRALWVADSDGSNAKELDTGMIMGSIAWSSDAKRLAYRKGWSNQPGGRDLYAVDLVAGKAERLTESGDVDGAMGGLSCRRK